MERDKLLGWLYGQRALGLGMTAQVDAGGQWKSSAWGRGECHENVKSGSTSGGIGYWFLLRLQGAGNTGSSERTAG